MSVYKLVGNGLTYYGSTTLPVERRIKSHKCQYDRYLQGKTGANYMTSFEIIKGKYEVVVLETGLPKEQMKEREIWFIRNNECVNKVGKIPIYDFKDEERVRRCEYLLEYNKKRSNKYKTVN
jgi:hypothetical protein